MYVVAGLLIAILALSLLDCADSPPGRTVYSAASGTPTAASDKAIGMPAESLHLSLNVPEQARHGQAVPIVIRLENRGERPLDLYLRGRTIAFDIFVSRPDGHVVWQRLKDEIISAIIQVKVLQPGEVLELKDEWRQRGNRGEPVGPGRYLVRAAVLTDGPAALETTSASLRIVAR
jgi:hypothetical protein